MAEGVAGIDWASEVHVACVLDGDGAVTGRFSFTHDAAAIRSMVRRLSAAGVGGVAIERGDGPVVEELLEAGLAVFVVPSRQVKGVKNLAYPVFGRDGHAIAALTTPYIERIDNAPVPSMSEVGEMMKRAAQTLTSLMGFNVYWDAVM